MLSLQRVVQQLEARKNLKKAMHWYAYRALKDPINLSLRFSPRQNGNRWLLHDTCFEDTPIILIMELDNEENADSKMIERNIWELICEALDLLKDNTVLEYILQNKIKMIMHLKGAKVTRNQLYQLARIIEDHEFQDFIVLRN